jgi:hypothetical protein
VHNVDADGHAPLLAARHACTVKRARASMFEFVRVRVRERCTSGAAAAKTPPAYCNVPHAASQLFAAALCHVYMSRFPSQVVAVSVSAILIVYGNMSLRGSPRWRSSPMMVSAQASSLRALMVSSTTAIFCLRVMPGMRSWAAYCYHKKQNEVHACTRKAWISG